MATLRDYIRIKHGYAFKGQNISTIDNNVVLVTPGNFSVGGGFKEDKCKYFDAEYPYDYVLKEDDLIVTMTDLSKSIDTLGYSALVPTGKNRRVYLHNQRIGLVTINSDELNKHYIYWFMRSPYYQKMIAATSTGSTVHHTSPDRILDVEIELPKLEDQNKIAAFLDNIENRIQLNNEINNNLEEQLSSLFTHTFADSVSLASADTCPMMGDLVTVIDNRGKTPPLTTETLEYPIIDVGALKGAGRIVDFNNCTKYVDQATYDTWFRSGHPKPWDILLSTVGSLAEMKIYLGTKGCMAQNVVALRATSISPLYLYQYLHFIRADLVAYNIGSVQPSIKVTHIIKHPIFVPEATALRMFEETARAITQQLYANYNENESLKELRDTLLPKLMSGELDVSDLDI